MMPGAFVFWQQGPAKLEPMGRTWPWAAAPNTAAIPYHDAPRGSAVWQNHGEGPNMAAQTAHFAYVRSPRRSVVLYYPYQTP